MRFIRLKEGSIIGISSILAVEYDKESGQTRVYHQNKGTCLYSGDHMEEIWELIKLANKN